MSNLKKVVPLEQVTYLEASLWSTRCRCLEWI